MHTKTTFSPSTKFYSLGGTPVKEGLQLYYFKKSLGVHLKFCAHGIETCQELLVIFPQVSRYKI